MGSSTRRSKSPTLRTHRSTSSRHPSVSPPRRSHQRPRSVSPHPRERDHHRERDHPRERDHRTTDRKRRHRSLSTHPTSDSEGASSETEKRHKKHKKDKKHKKKAKKTKKSKLTSVGDQWGKYGVIYEADIFTKESEFQAWLIEVKHVDVESVNNIKRKELFIDFMEDYNTATMSHEKFYDLHKWEARQRALRMGEAVPTEETIYDYKNDEEQLRQQQKQAARLVASKQPMLTMSQQQIEELSKVNRERVQAERMRRLGLTPKEGMGVRYEYE
ncbi:hypothetical protein BDF14DRAFT_1180873 [Spinellus fusiger]|nr:hypothetical protein BDF14DRAFT_1180873 [Spinellus fusiger]